MKYDYKKGDILIDSEGDLMEYLGAGNYKWITFSGTPTGPEERTNRLSQLNARITYRKLTKLEQALR